MNNNVSYSIPKETSEYILNNDTTLSNNPSLPEIYDRPFLLRLAEMGYKDVVSKLQEVGIDVTDKDAEDVRYLLSKLFIKCKKAEKPYKDVLEKICINSVIKMFQVPEETVSVSVELKDEIDDSFESVILDPIDGDEDFEFDDVDSAKSIRGEVYKRRAIDALCFGASMTLSEQLLSNNEDIEKLNPELSDIYKKIALLNYYMLFYQKRYEITDENNMLGGTVEVTIGGRDEKVCIYSQGKILPFLLSETIRGFMELFASHGLPSDKKIANLVLGKSDFVKSEPWDMIFGKEIWEIYGKSFSDMKTNELPYILKTIACLDVDKFNYFSNEVLSMTKKGKSLMAAISKKAKNDMEYDKFAKRMTTMATNKSIITDEFIGYNEL